MRILLITEDTDFGGKIERLLSPDTGMRFDISRHRLPEQALEAMADMVFSLTLYHVPDSAGALRKFRRFLSVQPPFPVVALTSGRDDDLERSVMEAGAYACLNSENLLHELLYFLTVSVSESTELEYKLNRARMHARQEREMRIFYERIGHYVSPGPRNPAEPTTPLRESQDAFGHYANRFGDLLEMTLESQVYKVDYNLSETIRAMAEELCYLRAGPRDVVDVYSAALQSKRAKTSKRRYQAYTEEGRLLLLEMMGYMVTFYKKYSHEHSSDLNTS